MEFFRLHKTTIAMLLLISQVTAWLPKRRHCSLLSQRNPSIGDWSFPAASVRTYSPETPPYMLDGRAERPRVVILIPAYNEEERIQSTLQDYQEYLLQQANWIGEIVVVDDGSSDGTCRVVNSFPNQIPIQCIAMQQNEGKGAALAMGIRYITETRTDNATLILTQDADGSGNLEYMDSFFERMKDLLFTRCDEDGSNATYLDWNKPAIVTGNRNYNLMSPRGVTRWGFQAAVKLIMNDLRVQDSQCGYKLMTMPAARDLYDDLELSGWAHDVEVLYRAKLVDVPIREIAIDWIDKDGSKVVASGVANVSVQMLVDIIRLRWLYSNLRAWLNLGEYR